MICKKCIHESYCDMAQFGGHEPPIMACPKYKKKLQTHADSIRAMTDEELADYLRYYSDSYARYDMDWLDWLKQEVKDNE